MNIRYKNKKQLIKTTANNIKADLDPFYSNNMWFPLWLFSARNTHSLLFDAWNTWTFINGNFIMRIKTIKIKTIVLFIMTIIGWRIYGLLNCD